MCKKYILNRRLLVPKRNPESGLKKLVPIEKGSCFIYCDELNTPGSINVVLCRSRNTSSERIIYRSLIIMKRNEFERCMTEERD